MLRVSVGKMDSLSSVILSGLHVEIFLKASELNKILNSTLSRFFSVEMWPVETLKATCVVSYVYG